MNNLKKISESRENNFQLIRFAAASGVFLSHTFPLGGFGLGGKAQMLGHVSLNVFFVISGFLVCKSYFVRPIKIYLISRFLRIFPALTIAVFISVFVIGLGMTSLDPLTYLGQPEIYEYIVKNVLLIFPDIPKTLPGVFHDSTYIPTVNAPLWSLPYEVFCYLILALIGFITKAKTKIYTFTLVSSVILTICYYIYTANIITKTTDFAVLFDKDFYRLLSMFFLGVFIYLFRHKIILSNKYMVVLLIVFCMTILYRPVNIVFFYLTCAYLIFYFAFIPRGYLLKFNLLGDYSYGIYILGYPIQQAVESLYPELNLISYFTVSYLVTLLLAILSWHIIEKKSLLIKTRLIN